MHPIATIGAAALVIENGKVLLVMPNYGRAKDHWILPGGFAETGETLTDCALRELKEETGQTGEIIEPFCVRYSYNPTDVYWIFKAKIPHSLPLKLQAEELNGITFLNIDEALNSNLVRPLTKYVIAHAVAQTTKGFAETIQPKPFSFSDSLLDYPSELAQKSRLYFIKNET